MKKSKIAARDPGDNLDRNLLLCNVTGIESALSRVCGIFFLVLIALAAVVYITRKRLGIYEIRQSKAVRGFAGVFLVVLAVYLVGSLLSSPIVNAAKYQKSFTGRRRRIF